MYEIGAGVGRAVRGRPWERQPTDPLHRPLKIFTVDPTLSTIEGAVALVDVPWEPLAPGPRGRVFEVESGDGESGEVYRRADLENPAVLIRNGLDPSASDPRFHGQMVYAVASRVYAAFRAALGRDLAWGFDRETSDRDEPVRLRLRPFAFQGENAYYHRDAGEIRFGYFNAAATATGRNLPRARVFTCLSHDVVAHESTHALLDGLRAEFAVPSGPDVFAFHEALADLVAIFTRFSYETIVQSAIRRARGHLERAAMLTDIARQFGNATGKEKALRSAIDNDRLLAYDPSLEPHALGSVLVAAVFEAFTTVFSRKTAAYVRLATNGTGVVPPGEIPVDLQTLLARKASQLAEQFLSICIRAIDYCPPVGIEFGEFLRAMITADHDLVPADPWGYREAWVDAFRRRGIYPRHVAALTEDALLWRPPSRPIPTVDGLSFARLQFDGDPGRPASAAELVRQAQALGALVTKPLHLDAFGLASPADPRLGGDGLDLPCVQSVRSSRRIGPDGQIVFDLVGEVTQRRRVAAEHGHPAFDFYGGSTVIIGPRGAIRYVICKSVLNADRLEEQRRFIGSEEAAAFWIQREGRSTPVTEPFRLLHAR